MRKAIAVAPDRLDFARLIRAGDTVGWAEAAAEPVLLTRMLGEQASRCPPFRVFSIAVGMSHGSVGSRKGTREGA